MKKIFFLSFLFIQLALANPEIFTIARVNNTIITNLDLQYEIRLLKILNKDLIDKIKNIDEFAISSLIEDSLKKEEIKKYNIESEKKDLNQKYYEIFNQLKINNNTLPNSINDKILDRIKRDIEWNILISKLYSWKVNINLNEIEEVLKSISKDLETKEYISKKQQMIDNEKKKKLQIYSQNHLNNLKKNSIIKFTK